MALVLQNRVQETATPNTTVSFTLTGAVSGFQSFASIGNGNTTYYSATDASGNWEVGLGTFSTVGPTLTRTTIYGSSNSGGAVTFPGGVNVFVTYPSGRSVNLDAAGNVSALGTVASGTWQGSTVGVAYGGTGVTSSSGANSVVLRDSNANITANRVNQANTATTAAGGITALTAASSYIHSLVGTGGQTYELPDATTLTTGVAFIFNNLATGTLTIRDNATATIGTIPSGGAGAVFLTANATVGGTWDLHGYLPEGVTFGTNTFNLGTSVISGGTWQGGTVQPAYGGTGLTTFAGADNALYSTGTATLTAGTLPFAAGGTGQTTRQNAMDALAGSVTSGQYLRGNGTDVVMSAIQAADVPTLNQNTTGTSANVTGTVAVANGGTGQTSYTNGQLLIGNTTGNTLTKATLTAGCGVTITNGAGSITISAAGGGGGCPATPTTEGVVYGETTSAGSSSKTALGFDSGGGNGSVAVGYTAYAGTGAVAIGSSAAANGSYSIAIGKSASALSANSISINATACCLPVSGPNRLHIAPIRGTCFAPCGSASLYYDAISYEVFWASPPVPPLATPSSAGSIYGRAEDVCCGGRTALGVQAGFLCQSSNAVAIGARAGYCGQNNGAVAVGTSAGNNGQGSYAVAIGRFAGNNGQGGYAVAIGLCAGTTSQGFDSVAIGREAGAVSQGLQSVAIGKGAGYACQGACSVAVGSGSSAASFSVAVGSSSSANGNSIAIGSASIAAYNSIAIGVGTVVFCWSQTHIGPLRNATTCTQIYYNPCTRELTYG